MILIYGKTPKADPIDKTSDDPITVPILIDPPTPTAIIEEDPIEDAILID